MSGLRPPTEAAGELMAEVIDVALQLAAIVRDEGPEAVADVLASLPDDRGVFAPTPGGIYGALAVALAAMVDPDATPTQLLAWTETEPTEAEVRAAATAATARLSAPPIPETLTVLKAPERKGRETRPRLPREHGTDRGYMQHRTHGDPVCADCRAAHRVTRRPEVCQHAWAELVATGMPAAQAADETTLPKVLARLQDQMRSATA